MLRVKTRIEASEQHGFGLFADQDIPAGEVVWQYDPELDISITKETYEGLPEVQKTFFDYYGYWSEELQRYIVAADGWRFTNHSREANTGTVNAGPGNEGQDVALRDIKKGEELLFDYRSFGEDPERV